MLSRKLRDALSSRYHARVHDLLIVGGGPAGLLAAARCARAGLDVLVLEEHDTVGDPTHCTGIVSLEVAEMVKIPDEIVLHRLRRARLVGPGGSSCEVVWPAGAEEVLAIDRGAFDRRLANDAVAAGADLRTGARVDTVSRTADAVEVTAAGERIRARALVLACGVSYGLLRQLGFGLPGRLTHTAQVEVDAEPADVVEVYFGRETAPEGFAWLVPVQRDGRRRLKVGVLARGDAGALLQAFLDRPAIRRRLAAEPDPPLRRVLPLRPVPRTYGDRVLITGDAAGLTKATTGGGIFYGLLSAGLAAETLVEAFGADRLDGAFLRRYERRWRERLEAELRIGDRLRQLVSRCTDEEIDTLVRVLGYGETQRLIARTVRFNWHRPLILGLLREPRMAPILLSGFFR